MADNHDKFRQEFKSDQLLIFEKVAGSMLNQLGYKTIFWTPALSETFTEEELTMFKEEDQYLRKQAMLKADPVEISNRKAQDNLYQEIISRKPIPV